MGKNFMNYKARDVARGLKRFLGRHDTYGIRWLFLDGETVLVRFEGSWRPVWFAQVRKYLPCESHPRRA